MSCWSCGKIRLDKFISTIIKDHRVASGIQHQLRKFRVRDDDDKQETINRKLVIPKAVGPLLGIHKKYLQERGFDWRELEHLWKIGGIGQAELKLAYRIYIPIIHKGQIVSWTARSVVKSNNRRYFSASEEEELIPHKTLLYGEDYVRGDTISVHEGPFDVYRIGPGATCTFGTKYTTAQLKRISRYKRRVICFDSNKEGQAAARQLVSDLAPFEGETFNVVLDVDDAGVADKKTVRQFRREFFL
jgi:hypothetical protein